MSILLIFFSYGEKVNYLIHGIVGGGGGGGGGVGEVGGHLMEWP